MRLQKKQLQEEHDEQPRRLAAMRAWYTGPHFLQEGSKPRLHITKNSPRDMFELVPRGPDTFVGTGPRYPWGGLYGGQIVAQALKAAADTVEPDFEPHSIRAYFIRPGDHAEPVRYEVDRIRNGRSFTTRRVVARQAMAVARLPRVNGRHSPHSPSRNHRR